MKMMRITPEVARRHYAEHVQKAWYPELEAFITGGPAVAMIVEGPEAIRVVRDMAGATNGLKANPGTIRGDFSASQQMNLVHASDSPESAKRELEIFFPGEKLDGQARGAGGLMCGRTGAGGGRRAAACGRLLRAWMVAAT